jgi:hypothetical protein
VFAAVVSAVLLTDTFVTQSAQAQTRVFRCDGPDGTPLFQNTAGKGCRELDLPPINSVPAPRQSLAAARAASAAPTAARAGSFPRVEAATQRERDSDRQRLLSEELKREQERFGELQKEFNNGEPERRGDERNYQKYLDRVERLRHEMSRAESSIGSLERELNRQRD